MELISALLWAVLITLTYYIYIRLLDVYNFWKRKKIAFLKPVPLIGNFLPVLQLKYSMGDVYSEAYWSYPEEKVVGVYNFLEPMLVVRDLNLIENILIKDFNHFEDQVTVANDGGLMSFTLFQLKGNTWRSLRYKVNTCFTSNKLKQMFNQMLECTDELSSNIENNLNNDIEIRNILATFNADVTANCVFGIKLDRTANKIFSEMVLSIFDIKPLSLFRILILLNFPKLANILGLKFLPKHVDRYMRKLIEKTLEQRTSGEQKSNDYLQLLLNLKEKGTIGSHHKENWDAISNIETNSFENIEITDNLLAGQAFQFLAGGFDPINNAMIFSLYEIARNSEVQANIRNEVKNVLSKHGGYTFEAIKEMTYLENCIQETMRFFPLLPFLFRTCTKTYVTSDGLIIDKGQKLAIPLSALHMDPKYFPEPQKFDPCRFDSSNGFNRSVYLPYGGGPRICLGMRFSMVEMKLGLAKIIEKFKFTLSPKTKLPLELNKQAFFNKPKYGIYLNFEACSNK